MDQLMLRLLCALIAVCGGLSLAACEAGTPGSNEVVMCKGFSIIAERDQERLSVSAEGPRKRTYTLGAFKTTVDLFPRRERWYGSLGLYRPYGEGNTHLVLDEGYQYFDSEQELFEWLAWQNDRLRYVYSSDGLIVGWRLQLRDGKGPQQALAVELWQALVKGKKPERLANSSDHNLSITRPDPACPEPNTGYTASEPKHIGNRQYSGRALDFLRERGIDSAAVEKIISQGKRSETGDRVDIHYNDPTDTNAVGISWVRLDHTGKVLLVG